MLSILVSAAFLGGIIALLQESDFPGWMEMIICVFAAIVPTVLLSMVLPGYLALLAPVVGAGAAAVAISATCGMTIGRSALAAGLWLVAQTIWNVTFAWLAS